MYKKQVLFTNLDLRGLYSISKGLGLSLDSLSSRLLVLEAIPLPEDLETLSKYRRRVEREEEFTNIEFVIYYTRGKVVLEGLAW